MTKEEIEAKKKEILERRKESAKAKAYHLRYELVDIEPTRKGTYYYIDLPKEDAKKYRKCYAVCYTTSNIDGPVEPHYAEDLINGDENTVMCSFYYGAYFYYNNEKYLLSAVIRKKTPYKENKTNFPFVKRLRMEQTGGFSFKEAPLYVYMLPLDKLKIVPAIINKKMKFNEEDMEEIKRLDPNYEEWFEQHPNVKKIREESDEDILILAEEELGIPDTFVFTTCDEDRMDEDII